MFANLQVLRPRVLLTAGIIAVMLSSVTPLAIAQTTAPNEWTWMGGSSQGRQPAGVYGQLGVAVAGNTPGGRTLATVSWTDTNGNLWLFGSGGTAFDGAGTDSILDDVWEYNTSTQEWTWMAGSSTVPAYSSNGCYICDVPPAFGTYQTPNAGTTPGSLQSPTKWIDTEGNLWLFGGFEYKIVGGSYYQKTVNALWEFNVSSHEWAWMGGSNSLDGKTPGVYGTLGQPAAGNTPGGRSGAVSWTDSNGNLWLFGGNGQDSAGNTGYLNDLWKYNPSTNQWTWMGGSSTFSEGCVNGSSVCSAPGVYGTLQVPATGNIPYGRSNAFQWTDSNGNVWVFGGLTQIYYDINGTSGLEGTYINDLWEFNSTTHEWTWMSGNSTFTVIYPGGTFTGNLPGTYGTLGTPSATSTPGGRIPAGSAFGGSPQYTWTDSSGNLWLFGGSGFDSTTATGTLNDLWKFDTSLNEWAWMGGSSTFRSCTTGSTTCSKGGVYGTLGTPAAGNIPGARAGATQWIDGSGNVWLFGGWGADSVGTWGVLNDLWKFTPSTNLWTWMAGSTTVPNDGSNSEGQFGVYGSIGVQGETNMPGGRQAAASWTDSSGMFWIFGGSGCSSNYCGGWLNDLWVYAPPSLEIIPHYFLTAAPNWVSVPTTVSGGSGTTTVTSSVLGGYDSTVALAASGQPTGINISFNPTSITGAGSSTMTITVSAGVAFGTYSITVTGTSGSISQSTTVTLSVSSATAAATPTFNPPEGTYTTIQSVTIGDTTPGATIYYTTNNTTPTTISNIYNGPITVSSSEIIKAMAVASGYPYSAMATATYTINLPVAATPTFSLASGTFATAQTVAISDATPGTTIYYTADGTVPTASSAVYSTPITVSTSKIIQAIAVASNYLNSAVASADYAIWPISALGEWAWMAGTQTPQAAVYGTLKTPAIGNMPGNRELAVSWTDSNGNLWLFGGSGFDSAGKNGYLNDLWEFNPSTNEWTWMGGSSTLNGASVAPGVIGTLGVSASENLPEGREGSVSWTDASGNLWLFGGNNYASGSGCAAKAFNDLWKYNPSTNQWTWMSGASQNSSNMISGSCAASGVYGVQGTAAVGNVPGSRTNALSWIDSHGDLWLLGGSGFDSAGSVGNLNDLWEFSPSTNEWTWMGGSSTVQQSGVYGTKGTPAAGNIPGSRYGAVSWTDGSGNFWLFGGNGYDSAGKGGLLNDLWEYFPSTGIWAWMGGSSTYPASCTTPLTEECGASGVYGTLQTFAAENFPGSRIGAVSWSDAKGHLWLFGGQGIDSAGTWGYLNDLWEFNPSTNKWAWMDGSSTVIRAYIYCGQPGVYGTLQTPAFENTPSGRADAVSWTDGMGNLWLFGGQGVSTVGVWNDFEDLWEFQPNAGSLNATATPAFSPGSGTYTTTQLVTISDTTPGATIYYLVNGISPAAVYTAPIPVSSSEYIEAYAVASGYSNSPVATATYTMNLPVAAAPAFSLASGTYVTEQTVTISDATPGTTIYYTTDGTMPTATSAVYSTPITIASSTIIQAVAVASNYLNSAIASAVYTIGQTSTLGEWAWMGGRDYVSASGVYGTLGVPSAGGIPGARSNSVRWTDHSGNLWLFGGSSNLSSIGEYNDLWEFTSSTNEWTWIGGSAGSESGVFAHGVYGTLGTPAAGNLPGSRSGSASWVDSSGNLWLFGGKGYDSIGVFGELNDLWEFNLSTSVWTWMGGSSTEVLSFYGSYGRPGVYGALRAPAAGNIPGSRSGSASWVDSSGNFWLFGGIGQDAAGDSVTLNDMWKFNPSTNQWTWMGGSNVLNSNIGSAWGVYGALGSPAAENIPGSRTGAASWTDSSGNFWMFGGSDPSGSGGSSSLNDLWKFNPSTNQWAWMSGSNAAPCIDHAAGSGIYGGYLCGQLSVNGALGVPAAGNVPGGRSPAASWIDSSGNLWLFGGIGLDHAGQVIDGIGTDPVGMFIGPINDLWYYNPSTNLWTWMGGNTNTSGCIFDGLSGVVCGGQTGVYGTVGMPAVGNIPGTRSGAVNWTDNAGDLWLFSGYGQSASFLSAYEKYDLNDLWEYRPSATTLPSAVTPEFGLQSGSYSVEVGGGPLAIFNGMANANIFYTTDGTTPTDASIPYSGSLNISASMTVKTIPIKAIATAPGYRDSSVASATYTISPLAATPTFSVAPGTYTSVQTVIISSTTPNATILYTTDGTTPSASSTQYTGAIAVLSTETLNAVAMASGYSASAVATAAYSINLPQAAMPAFSVAAGTYAGTQSVTISDTTPGATIYYAINGTPVAGTNPYSGAISVNTTETIEAVAVAFGYSQSAVATAAYTIEMPAATPTFSVPQGTYTSVQTVTISSTTPNATIYCAINTAPLITSSDICSGPITVSSTETLEAIATASGYAQSALATAAYTINLPNPAPVLSGVSPAYTNAGGAAFTLTVTGSGFISGSTVYWSSTALTTTYVSATQLTAQVPATGIATGGTTATITVQTPTPGGGTSNSFQFEVNSASGSTTGPTFTSTTVTVTAGSPASYPVTLPSSVQSATVTCLNLPAGATCSYSATTSTLTITTSSTTPKGTYQITVVFTETVSGAATSWILLPILLPLVYLRKKLAARGVWVTASLGVVLLAAAAYTSGCGGGGSTQTTPPPPQTHQVVSSGSVSITIQ